MKVRRELVSHQTSLTTHNTQVLHPTHIVLHNTQCTAQVSHQTSLTTHNTGIPYTTQNTQVSHTQHTTHNTQVSHTKHITQVLDVLHITTQYNWHNAMQCMSRQDKLCKKLLLDQTVTLSTLTHNNAFWAQNENLEMVERRGNNHPPERDCAADTVFDVSERTK